MEINIQKYAGHFHDGELLNITKSGNEITFLMSSAEVIPSEIDKKLTLSNNSRIRGALHLNNLQSIHITGRHHLEGLFKEFDHGTILDFEIKDTVVELGILWDNYPPKNPTNEFTTITLQAEHIWWENIPI